MTLSSLEVGSRKHALEVVFGKEWTEKQMRVRPHLWGTDPEQRIIDLRAAGFANPQKMIAAMPPILGYSMENIRQKIEDLRAAGFANPQKMIAAMPPILGLSMENIRQKIEDLRAEGFANPQKMIAAMPPILGLSMKNIRRKLKLAERFSVDGCAIIEYFSAIVGYSMSRLIRVAKLCRDRHGGLLRDERGYVLCTEYSKISRFVIKPI